MKRHAGKGRNRCSSPERAEDFRRHFINTQKAARKISIILEDSSKLFILKVPLFYLLTFIGVRK